MNKFKCPLDLDLIHCGNCYFDSDGKCEYDKVIKERESHIRNKKIEKMNAGDFY